MSLVSLDELMMRGMRDPYNEKKEAIAKRISGILGGKKNGENEP